MPKANPVSDFKPGDLITLHSNSQPAAARALSRVAARHGYLWVYLAQAQGNWDTPAGRVKSVATGYTTILFEHFMARPTEKNDA